MDTQDRAFGLLEGRQRPEQTRDLYLIAGIACGLMAKASHDFGAPHDAMTHARTGYACADNAGHDGLRAWIRGLQSGIAYWSGQLEDSVRYGQLGAEAGTQSRGTAGIRLASSEARSLAALNRLEDAHTTLTRATEARDRVQPDELDSLGGLYTFSWPRQLYFAADALAWGGATEANDTERLALEALNAYARAPDEDRAFGEEAGTRSALAVARVFRREIDGAAEALAPVLELPPAEAHSRDRDLGRACAHGTARRRGSGPGGHRVGGRHRRLQLRASGAPTMTGTVQHGVRLAGDRVRLRLLAHEWRQGSS